MSGPPDERPPTGGLPVVTREEIRARLDADSNDSAETAGAVAGVVLAAGTSSRFGEANKLLAEVDGEPIVRRAVRSLVDAPVEPVVVVLGYEHERVRGVLADLPVTFAVNDDYERGQSTSVRAGVEAIEATGADAVVIGLGDTPRVRSESVGALVDGFRAGVGTALAAAYEGRRGNPVLFARRHWAALVDVEGDVGGREILLSDEDAALIETGDPGVVADVDRREDLPG